MLLTAQQVADELGVSAATVQRWARTGQIEASRLPGGRLRIHRDQVTKILSAPGTSGPTPPRAAARTDSPPEASRASGGNREQSTAGTSPFVVGPSHGAAASDAELAAPGSADEPAVVGGCSTPHAYN